MKTRLGFMLLLCSVSLALPCSLIEAQTQNAAKQPLTTSIDQVIAPGDSMIKMNINFTFDNVSSVCWDNGVLLFSNTANPAENSCTYRVDPNGTVNAIREHNGRTMAIVRSTKGTYYSTDPLLHQITEFDRDGKVLGVGAGTYNGKRIDSPNDLFVDQTGGFYFSDTRTGTDAVQDTAAVYYVKPDGTVIRVIGDIEYPNGIALSPDNKVLYLTHTRGPDKGRYVYAYDINPDHTLSNKRQFCEIPLTPDAEKNPQGNSGADGCAMDAAGNLFVTTTSGLGIQVFNAAGTRLGAIPVSRASCIRFGGTDMKTLYAAARDGVYMIRTKIPGLVMPPGAK